MNETVQKADIPARHTQVSVWNLTVICILAWLIPGAGHMLLRRLKHGLVFLVLIVFLFYWGLSLGAKIYHYEPQQPLTFFAMIAQTGMGIPYFLARYAITFGQIHPNTSIANFAQKFHFGQGNIENVTFEYGNTFAIVAGLLNFLVILDAYDIATGKKELKNA